MPKVIKKRPARKKPVEEHEVKSAALQALEKLKERQKHVIIGVSVIAAVVVIFLGTSMYSTSQYKKASSLEQEASNYYYGENIDAGLSDQQRLDKALELFTESADVKVTPTNLYYLGNTYFRMKNYEKAIETYTRFIDRFGSEKIILPLVYEKLASSQFKTGNNEAALNTLGRLAGIEGGIFKDTALFYEARYLEGAGKKAEAIDKYREILTRFPSSPWAVEANAKVSAEETKADGDKSTSAAKEPVQQSEATPQGTGNEAPAKK